MGMEQSDKHIPRKVKGNYKMKLKKEKAKTCLVCKKRILWTGDYLVGGASFCDFGRYGSTVIDNPELANSILAYICDGCLEANAQYIDCIEEHKRHPLRKNIGTLKKYV